jgi:hypothetical protein
MGNGMTESRPWPTGVSTDGRSEGGVDMVLVVDSNGALLWMRKSRRRRLVGGSPWAEVGVGGGGTGVQVGKGSSSVAVQDCVRHKHGVEATAGSMKKARALGDGSSPWLRILVSAAVTTRDRR